MKFAFLVQGEGRGHMTQAIALYNLLTRNGHHITCVFIGISERRKVPEYFYESIDAPVIEVRSPNFVTDDQNKSIRIFHTLWYNTGFLKTYWKSLKKIHNTLEEFKPDVLINFYDFLGGFYFRLFKTNIKHVAIGHQFLAEHPDFPFKSGAPVDKKLFQINNYLMSMGATKKIALSFMPYEPLKVKKTVVTPPLVREEIKSLEAKADDFILGYMVNAGYGTDIIEWHKNNKEIRLHCFWDNKQAPNPYEPHENITFHQVDAHLFQEYMKNCKGYVSTAGFESICEAMYLGKPVLMVPVEGQYEQACNALDAAQAGAGIYAEKFDISLLVDYLPHHRPIGQKFREWVQKGEEIFLTELTRLS